MMQQAIQDTIAKLLAERFKISDVEPEISYPEAQFGDFATNVAFQLAGRLKRSPQEIASELAAAISGGDIASAEAAGGFVNLTLTDKALWQAASEPLPESLKGQTVVAEYSDPNPFKVLHAGHLYTTIVGDAISNLLEQAGAIVHRVNFGGDVGLHVAKAMWAILKELDGEHPDRLGDVDPEKRLEWLSEQYVTGTQAYEDDQEAKNRIIDLNKRIYAVHASDDHSSDFAQIYWACRQWSYDGFDALYCQLQITPFEKYYPESETTSAGVEAVETGLKKGVFAESDGAVVYRGEPEGLHTRVFLNSNNLPTYEAKDLGLAIKKWQDYHFDLSVVITANDIVEYMKVVLAALRQLQPEIADRSRHLTHGMIRLVGGAKMSSRKGNILRATDVLESASAANQEQVAKEQPEVVLAAVKYAFLKQRLGGDIVYDPAESVSLTGNSGPYLQYAHARAHSLLAKAGRRQPHSHIDLEPGERGLLRELSLYQEAVQQATNELSPHYICTYLYELSQQFNRFYEHNRVLGDAREGIRLDLVYLYTQVLKQGLELIGVSAPDQM